MIKLILPGDPLFNISLATLPPGWRDNLNSSSRFICRSGGAGILEQVNEATFQEYVNGGEFDQRLTELEDEEGEETIYFDM